MAGPRVGRYLGGLPGTPRRRRSGEEEHTVAAAEPAWRDCPPGEHSTRTLPVVARADGSPVALAVLVVRGSAPGKTLLATAGVHGDEFEGMAALRRLYEGLDPRGRGGAVGWGAGADARGAGARPRAARRARRDLARAFPGDRNGTVTEQLAHPLTHRLIRHADFYCDLHSAGQYYAMPPLVGYQLRPEPLLTAQRQAARAFGLPVVWG